MIYRLELALERCDDRLRHFTSLPLLDPPDFRNLNDARSNLEMISHDLVDDHLVSHSFSNKTTQHKHTTTHHVILHSLHSTSHHCCHLGQRVLFLASLLCTSTPRLEVPNPYEKGRPYPKPLTGDLPSARSTFGWLVFHVTYHLALPCHPSSDSGRDQQPAMEPGQ